MIENLLSPPLGTPFIAFIKMLVPMLVIGIPVFLIAMLPTLIAYFRKLKNLNDIMIVNVWWGFTIVGWFVALHMALKDRPKF